MFFTSSSSLTDSLIPWCPLMSMWHQKFILSDGFSFLIRAVYKVVLGWLVARAATSPWLPVAHQPSSLFAKWECRKLCVTGRLYIVLERYLLLPPELTLRQCTCRVPNC